MNQQEKQAFLEALQSDPQFTKAVAIAIGKYYEVSGGAYEGVVYGELKVDNKKLRS